jgi:hypothetical protein
MTLASVVPPALILKAILVRGGAFKATYQFSTEGLKERYFFVINRRPDADDKVVLLTASTQEEKRRQCHGARADVILVTVEPAEYSELRQRSVIDCESLIKRPRKDFEAQALARAYKPLPVLPESVIGRIVCAIAASRTLSTAEKRLILEPDAL